MNECAKKAKAVVMKAASDMTEEANKMGLMRSVEATESAKWLKEVANHLRHACGEAPVA